MDKPETMVAEKWKVPEGNIGRWMREKATIIKSAGKMKAASLLSRKLKQVTDKSKRHTADRPEVLDLKKHLVDKIKLRQLYRKPVTVKYVQREAKKRIRELSDLGVNLTRRGQPMKASRGWAWSVLIKSGNTCRKRGKGLASMDKV